MRRNFLTGLIICLIPTGIATALVGYAANKEANGETGFRRGIDLAGGTILVYEVNLDRTLAMKREAGQANASAADLSGDEIDIRRLANDLKRRIDPADLKNVVVRPVGNTRVEIILPFAGSTGGKEGANEAFVSEVRSLVSQTGVLEFRILANGRDDQAGIDDAMRLINEPADAKILESRAKAGLPPPAPLGDREVTINGQTQDKVQYEWVELGPEERSDLGLSNAYEKEPPVDKNGQPKLWNFPRLGGENRNKAVALPFGESNALFYSRDFIKLAPSRREKDPANNVDKKVEYFVLTRVSPTDALKVDRNVGMKAKVGTHGLNPVVTFEFNPEGGRKFGKMTERNRPTGDFKRQLAILLDNQIISAPSLNAVIRDSGEISGSFTLEKVKNMVYLLQSGALNAELKPEPVSENTVGPTLGADTIHKGLMAIALSFSAVLVFMVYYYRFSGFIACAALLVNLLLTVGFMVGVNAAFTLPGLAGIVLMLGMAVDANVLINERVREERDKGASLINAIRLGYDRAFLTIIDTHLTSIFTSIVLYTFGNDQLKGFAVSLTVGLIISLFTSMYMTRLMFDYAIHRGWMKRYNAHQLFSRPSINFMKLRYQMFALTATLTVLGLGVFIARGERALNVDFTKGTVYGGRLKAGEERGLSTSNGKTGLLELLSEGRQKERLAVKDVVDLTRKSEDGSSGHSLGYIYKIVYEKGPEATVSLSPDQEWIAMPEAEQLADVKIRAAGLPDVSVEQVFLRDIDRDLPSGMSRSFTVRTTEKESELVQIILDRLLRGEPTATEPLGEPLLDTTKVEWDKSKIEGPVATLVLDKDTSPAYLKAFILRQMKLDGQVPEVGDPAKAVEVKGIPTEGNQVVSTNEERSGRYTKIRVDVSNNTALARLKETPPASGPDKERIESDKKAFSDMLRTASAAFEKRPLPDRLETFDPTLAADTRNKALGAIVVSWLAILAYLWFRFGNWTFGLAAVICLIHDLCFTLGAIAACHYLHDTMVGRLLMLQDFKIDLPAVAALLTLVGYSVNEIIVNFARLREVRGKNPLLTEQTINDSVNQTLSRTILTSMTVFLVSIVLYVFGGEGIHLFAFVMAMGVLVSTFSSIYVASPLLLMLGEGKPSGNVRQPAPPVTTSV